MDAFCEGVWADGIVAVLLRIQGIVAGQKVARRLGGSEEWMLLRPVLFAWGTVAQMSKTEDSLPR